MSEMFVTLPDGRSFPVVPLRVKVSDRLILALVERKDKPDLRPFWVVTRWLRLVPGAFADYCLAMRSVPGWVENDCEERILTAMTILRVQKRRAGGGKETAVAGEGVGPRA